MIFVLFVLLLSGLPAAGEDIKASSAGIPGQAKKAPAAAAGGGALKTPAAEPFHPLLTEKPPKAPPSEEPRLNTEGNYSFRPLLIQGKKRLFDQSKDMRVEGESIVESELFSLKVDFKGKALKMLPEGEGAGK